MGSAEKTISVLARLQAQQTETQPHLWHLFCAQLQLRLAKGKTNGHSLSGEAMGFQGHFGESTTRKEI